MPHSTILKIDVENLSYRSIARMAVVKNQKVEIKEFMISIYNLVADDILKMCLVNTSHVAESYTSILARHDYEELKKAQSLFVEFVDLSKQLQALFKQFENSVIDVRINLGDNLELGFYAMSDVKELTVLTIPFERTSQEVIINFMEKRSFLLEARCIALMERADALQARLVEKKKKNKELQESLERTYEEKRIIESRFAEAEHECATHIVLLNDANKKNLILQEDLQLSEKTNLDLNLSISELRSDIDSLKIGIEYYVGKTTHLQTLFEEMDKNTIPLDKYQKLYNMFCSAVADLLKSQIKLKIILSQHEDQKSENSALKEELTNCIDIINNLDTKLNDVEFNQSAQPSSTAQEENCDLINEMIQKLELQNAAIQPADGELK